MAARWLGVVAFWGALAGAGLLGGPRAAHAQAAPRLIAPLSTSAVTANRPSFRWAPATGGGAHDEVVELCRSRACGAPLLRSPPSAGSWVPAQPLPAGVVFWRV